MEMTQLRGNFPKWKNDSAMNGGSINWGRGPWKLRDRHAQCTSAFNSDQRSIYTQLLEILSSPETEFDYESDLGTYHRRDKRRGGVFRR